MEFNLTATQYSIIRGALEHYREIHENQDDPKEVVELIKETEEDLFEQVEYKDGDY